MTNDHLQYYGLVVCVLCVFTYIILQAFGAQVCGSALHLLNMTISNSSLVKERPPPTFGLIFFIGSKFTQMSTTLEQASSGSWSVLVKFEKHNYKHYAYLR